LILLEEGDYQDTETGFLSETAHEVEVFDYKPRFCNPSTRSRFVSNLRLGALRSGEKERDRALIFGKIPIEKIPSRNNNNPLIFL
jgi:hypothetical protein